MKLDIQLFADGKVIIEATIETNDIDAKIEEIEKKMRKLEKTGTEYKVGDVLIHDSREIVDATDKEIKKYEELEQQLNELIKKRDELASQTVETSDSSFEAMKSYDVYEYFREPLQSGTEQAEQLNEEVKKINFSLKDVNASIGKVGSSFKGVLNKVKKWGLALFGIRSAYMFIRQAMSTLSQYNQDLANKIQAIKTALATALEPIITRIVDWVYKLVGYLGYFIKKWTGFDIFKNSAKALKSGASSAKQIRKELAGFDEMNILGQNTTVSGGVASTGIKDPYAGLDKDTLAKIDGIIEKFNDWGVTIDTIKSAIEGVIVTIGAIKVGTIVTNIAKILGVAGGTSGLLGIVVALGLIDVYLIAWKLPQKIKETTKAIKELNEAQQNEIDVNIKGLKDSLQWLTQKEKKLEAIHKKQDSGNKLTAKENQLLQQEKLIRDNVGYSLDKVNAKVKDGYKLTESQKLELDAIKQDYKEIDGKKFKNEIDTKVTVALEEDKKNTTFWTKLKNGFQKIISGSLSSAGVKIGNAKGAIYYPPRLASGGVINQPGRGIPIGSAIGGERGAEGVIPLTDSQQMALLGEAIGRYITINANITNTMNGRVISKELQKINAENDFAYNR